ncbi:MAG: hypothetical protein ACRDY7_00615, partial [Acidimicrobiia bacterium]
MRRSRLLAAAVVVGAVVAAATTAAAHQGGRVQLFLKSLTVEQADGSYTLVAAIVDRDSGSPEVGFVTSVEGTSAAGGSFPSTPMASEAGGIYRATVDVPPGDYDVTLKSGPGPGTDPAIPLTDNKTLNFAGAAEAAEPATPTAGSETQEAAGSAAPPAGAPASADDGDSGG